MLPTSSKPLPPTSALLTVRFNFNLFCKQFFHFSSSAQAYLRTDIFFSLKIMLYNIPAAKEHKVLSNYAFNNQFPAPWRFSWFLESIFPWRRCRFISQWQMSCKISQDAVDKLFHFAISMPSPSLPAYLALVHESFNLSCSVCRRALWHKEHDGNRNNRWFDDLRYLFAS